MIPERTGLIVWLTDSKHAKQLERFGTVHYVSKKMHYAVLYVPAERAEEIQRGLQRVQAVRKVEYSYRKDLRTDYNTNMPDKTRFYTY